MAQTFLGSKRGRVIGRPDSMLGFWPIFHNQRLASMLPPSLAPRRLSSYRQLHIKGVW
jgi:hypothetical protein